MILIMKRKEEEKGEESVEMETSPWGDKASVGS